MLRILGLLAYLTCEAAYHLDACAYLVSGALGCICESAYFLCDNAEALAALLHS